MLVKALRAFAYLWLTAAFVLIVIGIVGTWMARGFGAVQDLMSPFNVVNYLAIFVTLAPGIGALMWADKLKARRTT